MKITGLTSNCPFVNYFAYWCFNYCVPRKPRSNHLASSSTILARIMQARSHNLGRTFLYFLLILQDVHAKCPFSCISCKKIVKILQATLARKLARFYFLQEILQDHYYLARNFARYKNLTSCKKLVSC